ncbi:MAG: NUDIX hydrolase [Dehalococcoidia bacterium]
MENQEDVPVPTPAVDASTVMLLRDSAAEGIEVLLLRRHPRSKGFAGAYVFPGGKVNAADRGLDAACWRSNDLMAKRDEIGAESDQDALGFFVAAVRETFEEAGILLATRHDGTPLTQEDLDSPAFTEARARLVSRDTSWSWNEWLRRQHLMIDLDALSMWSWWVTPLHLPYRFDTRFLVTNVPDRQCASADRVEATDMRWSSPRHALQSHHDGAIELRRPTIRNLETLMRYDSVHDIIRTARRGEIERNRIQA